LAVVEMRRLGVQDLVEVPHHGVRVQQRAIVERHPLAQMEHPMAAVRRIAFPGRGQAGDQLAGAVGDIQLPGNERIIQGEAGELVGAGAAVGLPGGQGNVRHGDGVRQARARRGCALRTREARQAGGKAGARGQYGAAGQDCHKRLSFLTNFNQYIFDGQRKTHANRLLSMLDA
jgi:hypothetical protein